METRLTGLAGADKKHDLLDMELETAERRISELSMQVRELREAAAKEAEATERERGLRANLEAVVRELEATLEREQERAEDFKVYTRYISNIRISSFGRLSVLKQYSSTMPILM